MASGSLAVGDDVVLVQPSGVPALRFFDCSVPHAVSGDSITVVLDRDVDVLRGDFITHAAAPAGMAREFEAEIFWLDNQPLNLTRKYLLEQGTRLTSTKLRAVHTRRDIHELEEISE